MFERGYSGSKASGIQVEGQRKILRRSAAGKFEIAGVGRYEIDPRRAPKAWLGPPDRGARRTTDDSLRAGLTGVDQRFPASLGLAEGRSG